MPAFLVLLISMQCFVLGQRHAGVGSLRAALTALGFAGLGVGFALSAHAHGVERGAAIWVASLMAAGLVAPFLAMQIARLPSPMQWRRKRAFAPVGQRLQAWLK